MNWQTVSLAQVPATPWRNGGGVTRELLAWPAQQDWQVRISVADIAAAGPFSAFAGSERWFAVIEGAGVELRFGEQARLLPLGVPLRFGGEQAVHCSLPAGPTRDLNLMAPPGSGQMRPVVPGDRMRGDPARRLVALYAHQQPAALLWGGDTLELPAATLAWQLHEGAMDGQLRGGSAWWLEVML
ncbi:HutD family protein [Ramlibacter sp. XY19]|uniref:HutD/Ves family protein n=1 Tax=Ramlibacter paludis TaxID=2908000 RepID=UPI0023DBA941|nr:HutD family protein [Ramlibacter paludis]MCG2592523.1 HutD family protein [Ramlibacter paludis]